MSIRTSVPAAALAAAACILFLASSASAATTVVRTDPGGGRLNPGSAITGTSEGTATISLDSTGSISCHGNFQGTFTTTEGNPSAFGTLSVITFSSCTDTLSIVSIDFCTRHASSPQFTASTTSGLGGTFSFVNLTLFCHVATTGTPGTGCYYSLPNSTGSFSNATSTLGFSGAPLIHTVPFGTTNDVGAFCGSTGGFSGNFANVHTAGSGSRITLATS